MPEARASRAREKERARDEKEKLHKRLQEQRDKWPQKKVERWVEAFYQTKR